MDDRLKFTCYVAHPMEAAKAKSILESVEHIKKELNSSDLGMYIPDEQEAAKVGKEPGEQCNYIRGLKKAGHYEIFHEEMWRIWFGIIDDNSDVIDVLRHLRMLKHINGNRIEDFKFWGDSEAVCRSDFIIVYLPDIKTVGTHWEMLIAALFRIPIYLILPDRPKTDANSTMIFGVEKLSRGKIFYSIKDCTKYIIEKYNLKIEEQKNKEEENK